MHPTPLPATRDLVLIGGGHTHALVLRKWGMDPLPGARLTVINPGVTAPYSGMLPGFVAGHYKRADLDIDLIRLSQFAGARLILGAVHHIDPSARLIHVQGRAPIGYDIASIDIGITSDMPDLPGFAAHGVPAKPLGAFADRWAAFKASDTPKEIAILGGGIAGAELAMAMAYALRAQDTPAQVNLIDRSRALSALPQRSQKVLRRAMADLGVTLWEEADVVNLSAQHITLADGRQIPARFVTGAAGARPYGWISDIGIETHEGFAQINAHLQTSDPAIFATGDCAHMGFAPRPKAGVFAVRQAPVLYENLRCALRGAGGMTRYKPQKDYLKLISLGRPCALADRFGMALSGRLMWRWKDRIDQTFMRKLRALPTMPPPALPQARAAGGSDAPAQPLCGGCGSKLGQAALHVGIETDNDDAAILADGDGAHVISTDHLRAFWPDPFVMAQIAATHALGDIWAMGATPTAALSQFILPRAEGALAERWLREAHDGAKSVLAPTGARIIGGHSSQGAEMTLGFTVLGKAQTPITLAGAKPGNALILTKPIGSGVIMAAMMQGKAAPEDVHTALTHMIHGQTKAAQILHSAAAMTDVTGFGLICHLANICRASQVGASIDLARVPLLPGALALSKAQLRSTLFEENRKGFDDVPRSAAHDLLFDPQTAGGLLAAVPGDGAALVQDLIDAGHPAAQIGEISAQPGISIA